MAEKANIKNDQGEEATIDDAEEANRAKSQESKVSMYQIPKVEIQEPPTLRISVTLNQAQPKNDNSVIPPKNLQESQPYDGHKKIRKCVEQINLGKYGKS